MNSSNPRGDRVGESVFVFVFVGGQRARGRVACAPRSCVISTKRARVASQPQPVLRPYPSRGFGGAKATTVARTHTRRSIEPSRARLPRTRTRAPLEHEHEHGLAHAIPLRM